LLFFVIHGDHAFHYLRVVGVGERRLSIEEAIADSNHEGLKYIDEVGFWQFIVDHAIKTYDHLLGFGRVDEEIDKT
jgi:hypothetical protein